MNTIHITKEVAAKDTRTFPVRAHQQNICLKAENTFGNILTIFLALYTSFFVTTATETISDVHSCR